MSESLREAGIADLVDGLRRLSTLEREFAHDWPSALGLMSSTPQVAQVVDGVHRLAGLEANAHRDENAAILAAIGRGEFGCHSQEVGGRWSAVVGARSPHEMVVADGALPSREVSDKPGDRWSA